MKKDLATSACVFLASCVLYTQAAKLPGPRFEALGPAFLPKAIIGLIGILSLLDMVATILKSKRKVEAARHDAEAAPENPGALFSIVLPVASIALFVAYILLIEYTDLPYLALTFVYLVVAMWTLALFRKNALLPAILVALGVTACIYLLFSVCLELILP